MARFCDLSDPEEVKGVIATKYKKNTTKRLLTFSYDAYLKFVGKAWEKPNYRPEHKVPLFPLKANVS